MSYQNQSFASFLADETGAVTVEFVVLTASIVLLAIASIPLINSATVTEAEKIESYLTDLDPQDE